MAQFFEAFMIILFGIAWPTSIIKSYRARTAKGKSLYFLLAVDVGYLSGILSKLIAGNISVVIVFYCLNFVLVLIDILLYVRNLKIDRAGDKTGI